MYDLGDLVTLSVEIRDATGTLADATNVNLLLTLPDGATFGPTPVYSTPTGTYTYTYTPTQVGRHVVRWVATGANASSYADTFEVADYADPGLVSLDSIKAYLNITSTSSDEELRQFILEATDIAERATGRTLRRRTFSENHTAPTPIIVLRHTPLISVTSVTESGTTLTEGTDYTVNVFAGTITRGSSLASLAWRPGIDNITITYIAGEADPNGTAQLLVKELVRHLWRTQRGASPMAMSQDDFVPGAANIMTYRVRELVDLLKQPGIG